MKIRIAVVELCKALTILQGVAPKRTTTPILSNVLLRTAGNGKLVLSSTDLDIGITLYKDCEVLGEGSITVLLKSLHDIAKMLSGPHVSLEALGNHHLSIKSGRTSARLVALPASEFPELPTDKGMVFADLDTKTFSAMIQKTIYSTSMDDERYNLTGVYFEPQIEQPNRLIMVSTDGHRLSRIRDDFTTGDLSKFNKVTLPRKGLCELLRMCDGSLSDKDGKMIKMGLSDRHAAFWVDGSSIFMRLIDKNFPDYTQVIPKLADKIMRAARQDFLLSLKRVSALSFEKTQSVKMLSKAGELTLSCINPEAGEVTDDVAVEYSGPDIQIGLNARYVIDALSSIDDENIIIKFTDSLSPILITGIKDESHQCVIMPMRM